MNKKLICMTIFGSLFTKSFASEAFLQAPEASENLISSVIDYVTPRLNSSSLDFWPSDESPLEIVEELADLFENAENAEDFIEAIGEDIMNLIEAEKDSLPNKIAQLEKIAVPALTVAGVIGDPEIGASIGAVLALGELVNEVSSLTGNSTVENAVLTGAVGSIVDQALGVSGNAGLVNNLGANAIGNLVKEVLNPGSQETNMNDAINVLEDLANTSEDEETVNQIESALGSLTNENGTLISTANELLENSNSKALINSIGGVLEEAGEAVENAVEGLGEKANDLKENLGDKVKEAAGKIGNFLGKN